MSTESDVLLVDDDQNPMTRWERFKGWLDQIIDVKIKALLATGFVVAFLVSAFEVQLMGQATARADAQCRTRIDTRDDLREVLFKIVDLSDLFEGTDQKPSDAVLAYTANRVKFINTKYPKLTRDDCDL